MCNHSSNHLDNVSEIRTRAIEIVNVFEMEFRLEKDIGQKFPTIFLFPTKLYLKNGQYLYSACSNPTDVVLLIVLSMIICKSA